MADDLQTSLFYQARNRRPVRTMPLTWKRYGALNDNGDAFRRVDAYEGYKSDLQSGMKESEAYARARDYLSNWGC